ncbi:MAG: hypothetical protein AAGA11_19550 [Pseudomonadota bacterium]
MKNTILNKISIMSLSAMALAACATSPETIEMNQTASYINMTAAAGQTESFAEFLANAAPIVNATEPGTELWFALQAPGGQLAIFDIFTDADARAAHFSGAVAGALKSNADGLVEGGWDGGVLANVNNSEVLSTKAPVDVHTATTATYISITAAAGQEQALADLLTAAGGIVAETEPKTLYWAGLRISEREFAIFDIFADESGRAAHFAGKVANILKDQANVLVEGGWDAGVVANVRNYDILAAK